LSALPQGVARSEQVLPLVIAATSPADAATRYRVAVALRQAGASWGVVAAWLHTTSAAVLDALDLFEHSSRSGQVGTVAAAVDALLPGGRFTGRGTGTGPSGSGAGGGDGSRPARHPRPSASPRPSSSPSDLLSQTVDEVLSLVPSPSPSPSRSAAPVPAVRLPIVPVQVTPSPSPGTPH
jgi:hypothetical protein